MTDLDTSKKRIEQTISRYKSIGLFGGLVLGGIVGAVVAGPHAAEWSATRSAITIFGSFGLGGLIGYVAGEIAVASLVSGPAAGVDATGDKDGEIKCSQAGGDGDS